MLNVRLLRFWLRFALVWLIGTVPLAVLLWQQPEWLAQLRTIPWWYSLGLTPVWGGVAYLWHWQQERRYLSRGRDVQRMFGHLVCLAELPPLHQPETQHFLLGTQDDPDVTESFHTLYASVQLAFTFSNQQYLLVTSTNRHEGKSLVAANLAQVSAQVGRRVLLIDGNWDEPSVHHYFGLSRQGRLGSLLQQMTDMVDLRAEAKAMLRLTEARPQLITWLNRAIQPTAHPNLFVLNNGADIVLPSLRHPVLMRAILDAALNDFDLVICDGPSMSARDEAWRSLAVLGEVLLVAAAYSTRRAELHTTLETLRRHPISPIGVVLNHRRPDATYPKPITLALAHNPAVAAPVPAPTPLRTPKGSSSANGNSNGNGASLVATVIPHRNGKSVAPVIAPPVNGGHHPGANGLDAAAERQRIIELEQALSLKQLLLEQKETELEQIFQAQTVQNDLFARLQHELTEQKKAYQQLQQVYREQNEDFFRLEQNARTHIQELEQKLAHMQTRFQQASVTLYRRFQENGN